MNNQKTTIEEIEDEELAALNCRSASAGSAWYADAMEVLRPLRWHLDQLVREMESHNRYARHAGEPLVDEVKVKEAREAGERANNFFSVKQSTDYLNQLFEHMANEHGLTLVDSELREIIRIAKSVDLPNVRDEAGAE